MATNANDMRERRPLDVDARQRAEQLKRGGGGAGDFASFAGVVARRGPPGTAPLPLAQAQTQERRLRARACTIRPQGRRLTRLEAEVAALARHHGR